MAFTDTECTWCNDICFVNAVYFRHSLCHNSINKGTAYNVGLGGPNRHVSMMLFYFSYPDWMAQMKGVFYIMGY